ncbi:MAG: hydrogenase 3 maturation endopeptidase HyCI [Candidatus Omnitrophica bacterium]|nr:hydrogenase 3 maturation endopeptidase HyCI [Candidatus Omnitrophota bacterium]
MKNSDALSVGDLAPALKSRLSGRVSIVGLGNIIRGDDGLGPKLIEMLKGRQVKAHLFDCGTAPENYIFPILSTSCDTVVLIDAADIGTEPGGIKIFSLDEISTVSFSTHNPSPRLFTDLLKTGKDNINIFVISVQPKDTSLGAPMSKEVLQGLEALAGAFSEAING